MKKLVMAAALVAASATSANAYVNIGLDFFEPGPVYAPRPVYVAPQPVYVAPQPVYIEPAPVYRVDHPVYYYPNGRDRHRNYDWDYWNRPHGEPYRGGPVHGGPGYYRR